jgi:hypothetical protein
MANIIGRAAARATPTDPVELEYVDFIAQPTGRDKAKPNFSWNLISAILGLIPADGPAGLKPLRGRVPFDNIALPW